MEKVFIPRSPQEEIENQEWLESLDYVMHSQGPERVRELFRRLQERAQVYGVEWTCPGNTPYLNTIPADRQPAFPGNREIERRIKSYVRWNAMAMVVRANRELSGIGGHISTYASVATLWEVAFNHFFRAKSDRHPGDIVYFQGHAAPGVYARAFLEGRLGERDLENFRRELAPEGGLPSYPHPWLLPGFWEFPTVSMGLSPIMAIYQARFNRYLEDQGLVPPSDRKVWAFLGDGEMDEPESMGAITLAARERLDNLIFVVNCNLQRLDGPVRGNGQIIQELEAAFRGAGWRVIKAVWGGDYDPLFQKDREGVLARALNGLLDGQAQRLAVSDGAAVRREFFGQDPRLLALVENLSDEQLRRLRRGGHDPQKVYAAYQAAVATRGQPVVVLAQTIKGYGLGEAGEGRNVTHQQKKLNEEELRAFRSRFGVPISDEELARAPFYRPPEDSEEMRYLRARREALGGYLPQRQARAEPLAMPDDAIFQELLAGSGGREAATTMAYVRLLARLLQDGNIGRRIVPIVPDEARTFGMESLFRQVGIYSHVGQLYEPVDRGSLLYYREAKTGRLLEEGITEAGSMSSFIAAGTAYATHGLTMIPFFTFYSIFGFQRGMDLIWAAADARARGFLIGATAGRTTLPGEGLQHQDGQTHHYAFAVPNLKAYDPAFAYEIAVIIREGLRRMVVEGEDVFYYITVMNELYPMPPMPEGVEEGILKGLYRFRASAASRKEARGREARGRAHLLGSGAILLQALKAADLLEERYGVAADVWSVTSYKELYFDAVEAERWNRLHPGRKRRVSAVEAALGAAHTEGDVYVAALDYLRTLPLSIAPWVPGPLVALGADGFGRSDGREALRGFFEVDARHIALAALSALAREGRLEPAAVQKAMRDLQVDPDRPWPARV